MTYIRLYLKDSPLLQTRNITNLRDLQVKLKVLYELKGFSSEFLLYKEFFDTTLVKCDRSIEKYLIKLIKLTNDLKARDIIISNKIIVSQALNNLTSKYEHIVAIISQSFRLNEANIRVENLFSQLLNESRRLNSKKFKETTLLTKPNKPKCAYYRRNGHLKAKYQKKNPK